MNTEPSTTRRRARICQKPCIRQDTTQKKGELFGEALTESGLVVEGQDLGELVEQLFGDSDYEYWVTVGWEDVARVEELLKSELGVEKGRPVLDLMRMAWESGMFQSDVEFRNWLETHEISSDFASYA